MNSLLSRWRDQLGLQHRDRLLGFSFILTVATIWVVASFAVQGIESSGVHPAVLTFFANSLFALYLPIYWIGLKIQKYRGHAPTPLASSSPRQQEAHALFDNNFQRSDDPSNNLENGSDLPSSLRTRVVAFLDAATIQLFRAACVVAPLWFLAQLTFNASLQLTTVTSNTILSSASSLFTFFFSVVFLSEKFTLFKLGCIAALISGTAMVTFADAGAGGGRGGGEGDQGSVAGDMLCLVSSVIYGAYTVAIRRLLGEDEGVAMTLFFGFMGGLIFFGVGPILAFAKAFHANLGSLTWASFGMVVAKGLLDNVLSDYLWARAILLVGPTLATAGLSMQVPIAIFLDALFHDPRWLHSIGTAVLTFLGGAVILIGFFALTASSTDEESLRFDETGGEINDSSTVGTSSPHHTRFNTDTNSRGNNTNVGGRLERAWERGMAKLEAELGDIEEDYEIKEFINRDGTRQNTSTVVHGTGDNPISTGASQIHGGSSSAQHRHHQHQARGGLAPLPPEPKFSLD